MKLHYKTEMGLWTLALFVIVTVAIVLTAE